MSSSLATPAGHVLPHTCLRPGTWDPGSRTWGSGPGFPDLGFGSRPTRTGFGCWFARSVGFRPVCAYLVGRGWPTRAESSVPQTSFEKPYTGSIPTSTRWNVSLLQCKLTTFSRTGGSLDSARIALDRLSGSSSNFSLSKVEQKYSHSDPVLGSVWCFLSSLFSSSNTAFWNMLFSLPRERWSTIWIICWVILHEELPGLRSTLFSCSSVRTKFFLSSNFVFLSHDKNFS